MGAYLPGSHRRVVEVQIPGACKEKIRRGDPKSPPHVIFAKRIYSKIAEATDGSTGASNPEDDLEDDGDERVEDNDEEEYDGDDFLATMDVEDGNNKGEGPGECPVVLGHAMVADRLLGNDEEGKNEGGGAIQTPWELH